MREKSYAKPEFAGDLHRLTFEQCQLYSSHVFSFCLSVYSSSFRCLLLRDEGGCLGLGSCHLGSREHLFLSQDLGGLSFLLPKVDLQVRCSHPPGGIIVQPCDVSRPQR